MLVFLKYNLRAIDYDLNQLKAVPLGTELPNKNMGDLSLQNDTDSDDKGSEENDSSDMESEESLSSDNENE